MLRDSRVERALYPGRRNGDRADAQDPYELSPHFGLDDFDENGQIKPGVEERERKRIAAGKANIAADAQRHDEGTPLRRLSWHEMVSGPPEPPRYHWHPWVTAAAVAFLVGAGESLKSWLALAIAVATAAGTRVFANDAGAEAIPPGPVVYLTAENALEEERRRCGLLKAGLRLPDALPITFVAAESLFLIDEADYTAILALVETIQPVALFIDSAIALSGLEQESDNSAVRAFMKTCILPFARQRGITVYLIGHSPKPSMQPGMKFTDEHVLRGAGDWRNASDVVLYLRRDPTLGETAVVLRHAKVRIGRRASPIWFALEEVDGGTGIRLVHGGTYSDAGQGIQAGVRKAILSAVEQLKASPTGAYLSDLAAHAKAAGISTATHRRGLDVLRGKTAWSFGPHQGQKRPVLTEDQHGRRVFVTLDLAHWPSDEEWE